MTWWFAGILACYALGVVSIVAHFVMRDHLPTTLLTHKLGLTLRAALVMSVLWAWVIHRAPHPWLAAIGLTGIGCFALIQRKFNLGLSGPTTD